jgi:hypothetical protein
MLPVTVEAEVAVEPFEDLDVWVEPLVPSPEPPPDEPPVVVDEDPLVAWLDGLVEETTALGALAAIVLEVEVW